ncbi:ribonuclease HII [Ignavigranum ruoffiae]|uniref:ribonuclease HII n=1 Tax=Ignavigranum ruoffiae TaxID=89093 RepID=UPI0024AD8C59|nr:ribonuclease HII [Ignavigranum ruoffiae]
MATIKEIKEILVQINRLDDPRLATFREDPRKGVSKLVDQRIKSIKKLIKLKEEHSKRQEFEIKLYNEGINWIAGLDEVGRGPLAGPVVAAAVILPRDVESLIGIDDSKRLNAKKRQKLEHAIQEIALDYAYGVVDNDVIDRVNIYQASKLAMLSALNQLKLKPDHLLIDAMELNSPIPQTSMIKGDQRSVTIAAAAILAKEYRDRLMVKFDQQYPHYDFKHNVGYGTAHHLQALKDFGPCPIHRRSFAPVKSFGND